MCGGGVEWGVFFLSLLHFMWINEGKVEERKIKK